MKYPALAIAGAFGTGILLGLHPAVADHLNHQQLVAAVVVFASCTMLCSFVLVLKDFLQTAAGISLLGWTALGMLAAVIAQQPLPRDHVLTRIAAGQIDTRAPLRWHGRLRDEPTRLPWGYAIELDLSGVETADGLIPMSGGMRLGYTPKEGDSPLADIHAGDEIAALTQAHLPQIYRDPGAFDRRQYLAQQNVHVLATLRANALLQKTGTSRSSVRARLASLRAGLRNSLDKLFPAAPRTAGLLRAMLLGDRTFIDREESVDYQKTGTFHVLVLAGLHVGALAVFLFWLVRRLYLPHVLATIFFLVTLCGYIAVIEQRSPVLRAGLMATITVLGGYFYRRLDLVNSAAVAGVALLLANPKSILDNSFQLSFLAIGCIGGLALPWISRHIDSYSSALRHWRDISRDRSYAPVSAQFRLDVRDAITMLTARLSNRFAVWTQNRLAGGFHFSLRAAELFVLSLALQIGMLPLMARDFHRVSLIGPVVNLLAVPLVGIIVPFGFLTLSLTWVAPALSRVMAQPLSWLVAAQEHLVSYFAGLPHVSYRIPGPPVWLTIVFFAAVVVIAATFLSEARKNRWAVSVAGVALFFSAVLIATYPFRPALSPNYLEVTVLDVGQGDSILVVSPRGSAFLIDGGGAFQGFRGREEHLSADPGEEAVSAYLWSRGFRKLDAVALTHGHQDHIGGLTAILQNFPVKRLLLGRETAAPAFLHLKKTAAQLGVPVEHELHGQRFLWDGVQVEFFWPEGPSNEIAPIAKNNDSLVVRLQYADRSILLPGDAEKQAEYSILSENDSAILHADILKVGHHGSKNSTMPEFLSAVAPRLAIISAGGENPYGHPSPVLLQRLQDSGVGILRTDRDGAVQILTDGHKLRVNCYIACREASLELQRTQPANQTQNN